MSRKPIKINEISGKRLKQLLEENNCSQRQLAELLTYTPQHINLLLQGKRRLPEDTAVKIAQLFYPYRYQWLMGYDDFKTFEEQQESILSFAFERAKILDNLIHKLAKDSGYKLIRTRNEYSDIHNYSLVCDDLVVAVLSPDDYCTLRHEIQHYARYLFDGLVSKQKKCIPTPYKLNPDDVIKKDINDIRDSFIKDVK